MATRQQRGSRVDIDGTSAGAAMATDQGVSVKHDMESRNALVFSAFPVCRVSASALTHHLDVEITKPPKADLKFLLFPDMFVLLVPGN